MTGYSFPVALLIWLSEPAQFLAFICLLLLILWFPNGRPPTPRWRFLHWWLLVAILLWPIGLFTAGTEWNGSAPGGIKIVNPLGLFPKSVGPILFGFSAVGWFSYLLILVLSILSLVIRYRSAGQQVRQQIRWFVFGGLTYVIGFVLSYVIGFWSPGFVGIRWASLISTAAIIPLYLTIGIAILRYRLWDIDLIIRKTLTYSLLTGLLAFVYFGSVVVLQRVFTGLLGEQPAAIIVISTLLIAALFTPLRRRIQSVIDRRFYRRKYDAQQVLADFAQTARNEVEVEALTAELLRVVQETMQPQQVSLWLREKMN
jgi:hypothetical protein